MALYWANSLVRKSLGLVGVRAGIFRMPEIPRVPLAKYRSQLLKPMVRSLPYISTKPPRSMGSHTLFLVWPSTLMRRRVLSPSFSSVAWNTITMFFWSS